MRLNSTRRIKKEWRRLLLGGRGHYCQSKPLSTLYPLYYWLIGCYDRQGVIICSICSKNSGLGHLWLTGNNDNAQLRAPHWIFELVYIEWDGWPLPSASLVVVRRQQRRRTVASRAIVYSKWRWSMVERSSHYNEVSFTSPLCYANGGAKSPSLATSQRQCSLNA